MKNIDSISHLRGESIYLDDVPILNGTLYAAAFDSPIAHGILKRIDLSALTPPLGAGGHWGLEGVVRIFTHKDIRGDNQIGGIIPDEPLLADHHVHFCGMPIALVVAESEAIARKALKMIKVEIEPLHIITDPREAAAKGEFIVPPKHFSLGDTEGAFKNCE